MPHPSRDSLSLLLVLRDTSWSAVPLLLVFRYLLIYWMLYICLWLKFLCWRYFSRLCSYEGGTSKQIKQKKAQQWKPLSWSVRKYMCYDLSDGWDRQGEQQPARQEGSWPSFPVIFAGYCSALQRKHRQHQSKKETHHCYSALKLLFPDHLLCQLYWLALFISSSARCRQFPILFPTRAASLQEKAFH